MRCRSLPLALGLLVLLGLRSGPVSAAPAGSDPLELYTAVLSQAEMRGLARAGFDVATVEDRSDGQLTVDLVLSGAERRALQAEGVALRVWRGPGGETANELAAAQQASGFSVWRRFDGPDGLRQHLYDLADERPDLLSIQSLGTSIEDREVLAVKLTREARTTPDGTRPAVLYLSGQHAREWIGPEVNRLLLHTFLEGYGVDDEITRLVDTRELWFVLVANPDGYELSFTEGNRLWRKNVRDNDGDGRITGADGVDLNRNFPAHWGYDDDGSSPNPRSESYRGAAPASEPETVALQGLIDRVPLAFIVNYHSVAQLLLYPVGWYEHARSADTALLEAYAGTPEEPAIPGYTPIASWRLYPTNGETCDYAYGVRGALCFTPEMSDGGSGQGFVFPDDPQLVAQELAINLPFALSVARSAADPALPDTHLDRPVPLLQVEPFAVSYGDPQAVQAVAARHLGDVTLHWRIGDGDERTAPASEWAGGERYGADAAVHYRWVRGEVTGAEPGDRVTVWFAASGHESERFTYEVAVDTGAELLVLAAEDYTGTWPTYERTDAPAYLERYERALEAIGRPADVYDVDGWGRTAPSSLGVLGHYDAVVWYTGDDLLTTQAPENAPTTPALSRLPHDTMLAVRDYLNEGGKLVYAGSRAGEQFSRQLAYQPDPDVPCEPRRGGCEYLSAAFLEQYLGASEYLAGAGEAGEGRWFDARGAGEPLSGWSAAFDPGSAITGTSPSAWVPTSRRLSEEAFPLFMGRLAARYDWPGLDPRTGEHALYSDWERYGWTRLVREVDLTGSTSAELAFWVARQTVPGYGWIFVEAHTVGEDDWRMLPDENGHTVSDAGDYCLTRIQERIHPHLAHYLTRDTSGETPRCVSTGTSGAWNAATGASEGWEPWRLDLSSFAGRRVEIAIGVLGAPQAHVGAVLDDVALAVDGGRDETSFEDGLGGWSVLGAPPDGYAGRGIGFTRFGAGFLPAGPVVLTHDTALLGFEPAHIADQADMSALLERLLAHLAPRPAPPSLYLPALSKGGSS